MKDVRKKMSDEDADKIDLTLLDENDPEQHQIKLKFICGIYFGLRGNEEHTFLEVRHFTHGTFPKGHRFENIEWYGLDFLLDKSHRLGTNKPYVRTIEETLMKLPVMNNDPKSSDPGGCIKRFLSKLSPGQTRIYCKVVPERQRKHHNGNLFYPNNCLGKEKILSSFRRGAAIMGLSNPKQFMPHTLRHMLGTHLANDPNVSLKECLSTMRHSSAAANLNYQANNTKSEENRLIALGFVPPEEEECSRSSSVTVKAICQKGSSFKTPCDNSMTETAIVTKDSFSHPSPVLIKPTRDLTIFTQDDDSDNSSSSYLQNLYDAPSTQNAIDIVSRDIRQIETSPFLSRKKSAERKQIISLGEQVFHLNRKLREQNRKIKFYEREYYGSNYLSGDERQEMEEEWKRSNKKSRKSRPSNPYMKMRDGKK